jgi:hypothetical protein
VSLQVVDALAAHFLAFEQERRVMPVVWHQGLLCFVTRYKHQLTTADRDALLRLTTKQHHHLVSAQKTTLYGRFKCVTACTNGAASGGACGDV